jgi:predicted ATPase/DNA-binding XRE family transcriptional regulator
MSTSSEPLLFADLLRRHRRAAGLTQEELAEAAGLGVRGVSDLERSLRSTPRTETVLRLAAALQLGEHERAAFLAAARRRRAHPTTRGVRPTSSGIPVPPLVGRTRELAWIERLVAGEGSPALLLAGEPGIGKTRLLQESAARAESMGWRVLAGGCTRRSGQEAYAPIVGALVCYMAEQMPAQQRHELKGCAWLARLLPELAESAVVPSHAWTTTPEQERRLMFAAVARYLRNVSGPAGTLLVLDDLQWAGSDALYLLSSLARTTGGDHPLRVLGAYRSSEVRPGAALADTLADLARDTLVEQVALAALAPAESAALLAALTPAAACAWSEELTEQVVRRTGGVPYFLVSCAQSLKVDSPDAGLAPPIPWNVTESIRQRVAHLSEQAQQLLRSAAVVGREAGVPLLVALAAGWGWQKAQVLSALEAAPRRGC